MSLLDEMRNAAESSGGGGATFLKLKDGEQVRVRFLNELTEDAPLYDKDRGLGHLARVHQNPANFKLQAACTMATEQKCWACEQTTVNKKWYPKKKFYIAVLVKSSEGNEVKVLNQGFTEQHVILNLIEFAEEYGTVCDRDYKIKRRGAEMNDTSYTITPLDKSDMPDLEGVNVPDLTGFVRNVPYAEQEAFFSGKASEEGGSSSDGW